MSNRDYVIDFIKRNKLSKAEFAKILGLSVSTVNHWDRGIRNVPELVKRVLLFFDDSGIDIKTFYVE